MPTWGGYLILCTLHKGWHCQAVQLQPIAGAYDPGTLLTRLVIPQMAEPESERGANRLGNKSLNCMQWHQIFVITSQRAMATWCVISTASFLRVAAFIGVILLSAHYVLLGVFEMVVLILQPQSLRTQRTDFGMRINAYHLVISDPKLNKVTGLLFACCSF